MKSENLPGKLIAWLGQKGCSTSYNGMAAAAAAAADVLR